MTSVTIDEFSKAGDEFDTPPVSNPTKSGLTSVYDQFRAELSKPVDVEPTFVFKAKGRPLGVRFSTDLPIEKLNKWRKIATKRSSGNIADGYELSLLLIAGQAQCFVTADGKDVTDDNGEWVNFRHQDVIESLGAIDYRAAILKFLGRDGEVIRAGGEILDKCGYGDEEEEDSDEFGDNDPLD
jgi:hypothetical protein